MLLLDPEALAAAPREIGLRALAALLMAVSGAAYRPRFEALESLFDRIAAGAGWAAAPPCMAAVLARAPRRPRLSAPRPL